MLPLAERPKFACVDGPDFDGHEVDFDEAMLRQQTYKPMEQQAVERENCRLMNAKPQE